MRFVSVGRFPLSSRQRGMALLIALIVLVVVSILGAAAMRVALFQNRVSINNQIQTLSFQAAESGLDAALTLARQQSLGPDGVNGTADDIDVSNSAHIFNQAISDPANPRRLCMTAAGIDVDGHGVRNADGSLGFDQPCDQPADSSARVTVVISEAPESAGVIEGFEIGETPPLTVQVRSQGDVPDTNVSSVHVEEWFRPGP